MENFISTDEDFVEFKQSDPYDRITVVEHIYYQIFGEDATDISIGFERSLTSKDEQFYERRKIATESWSDIDTGWLDHTGMIIIVNREGRFLQQHPTTEEQEEAAKKILEVSFDGINALVIPPKENLRCTPIDTSNMKIRSRYGVTRFMLYALPK